MFEIPQGCVLNAFPKCYNWKIYSANPFPNKNLDGVILAILPLQNAFYPPS